jgi:2-amino-4-hydroxy-6-hydroxymethyldihydropteridine diphosphokinase
LSDLSAVNHQNNECHTVFISMGSNMGDKVANCRDAVDALKRTGTARIIAQSKFYYTEPVDFIDQGWFINAVLKIKTALEPLALLSALQEIQVAIGRKSSGIRFGPRIIDLDIIFYDTIIFENERLIIPHPRMHKRRFVLLPLCDIDPQVKHPGLGQNVSDLLMQLNDNGQRICCYPSINCNTK